MADITMCSNKLCPNAGHCYRVQAPVSDWQSMACFDYTVGENGVICESYIPTHKRTTSEEQTGEADIASMNLLGCPFCGGAPDRIGGQAKFADMPWFRVQCVKCGAASGIMNARHAADNNWNSRQSNER